VTSLAERRVRMIGARSGNRPSMHVGIKRTWEIVSILLVIAACAFWAMFLRPQSLGGRAAYIIVSGQSMEPLYHTGDLILVERSKTYSVGDIIAYRVPKGDPMAGAQVIHRIIGGDARRGFLVQGDNRTAPDVWRPRQADVVGAAHVRIPQAAIALRYLRSPLLLGLLAASFVFVYALTGRNKEPESEPVAEPRLEAPTAGDEATPGFIVPDDTGTAPDAPPPNQIGVAGSGEPRNASPAIDSRSLHASFAALGVVAALLVLAYLLTGGRQKRG
jgi:signal peptidase